MTKTKYFCTAEWHFKRYMGKQVTFAALLYTFALGIAKDSGIFYCSGVELSRYFDCNKDTIYKAIMHLQVLGFFVFVSAPPGKPKVYRVLTHSEWEQENPGCCAVKTKGKDWKEYDFPADDSYSSHGMELTAAVAQSRQGASECSRQGAV